MADNGVAAREDPTLMAVVGPADQVGRSAMLTDFKDLAVTVGFTYVMTSNDQSIALLRVHRTSRFHFQTVSAADQCPGA
jgi:hypothetical protein